MSEQETAVDSSKDTLVPVSWWVQSCRLLWHIFAYIWVTLFTGIIVGTIANLSTATTDTPLSKFYIIHILTTDPPLFIIGSGTLGLLTLLSWLGCRKQNTARMSPPSPQNRKHFLGLLRSMYKEIQTQSLEGVTQVKLGFVSKPDAIHRIGGRVQRTSRQQEQMLPAGTSIVEISDFWHT